jgi:hypothetical protein
MTILGTMRAEQDVAGRRRVTSAPDGAERPTDGPDDAP